MLLSTTKQTIHILCVNVYTASHVLETSVRSRKTTATVSVPDPVFDISALCCSFSSSIHLPFLNHWAWVYACVHVFVYVIHDSGVCSVYAIHYTCLSMDYTVSLFNSFMLTLTHIAAYTHNQLYSIDGSYQENFAWFFFSSAFCTISFNSRFCSLVLSHFIFFLLMVALIRVRNAHTTHSRDPFNACVYICECVCVYNFFFVSFSKKKSFPFSLVFLVMVCDQVYCLCCMFECMNI